MIFVILGTQDKPFDRLIKAVEDAKLDDEIVVQAGFTKYQSDKMKIFDLVPRDDFARYIREADLIITHGGVGSIMTALEANKPVIVCARLAKYGEHQNDHQKEIIESFVDYGYVLEYKEGDDLASLVEEARHKEFKHASSNNAAFIGRLVEYIDSL